MLPAATGTPTDEAPENDLGPQRLESFGRMNIANCERVDSERLQRRRVTMVEMHRRRGSVRSRRRPGLDGAKTLTAALDERRAASLRQFRFTPRLSSAAQEASTPITMAPRPSITGFDPKKFAAASANGTKGDPWARYEQWRYTGPFTRFNRFKGSFPGLGIATVAFAGYLIAEQLLFKDDHAAHHDEAAH